MALGTATPWEYVKWRAAQRWGERPSMTISSYDPGRAGNPLPAADGNGGAGRAGAQNAIHGIPSSVVQSGPSPWMEISLPLTFGKDKYDESEPPAAATILAWSRKFEKARNAGR